MTRTRAPQIPLLSDVVARHGIARSKFTVGFADTSTSTFVVRRTSDQSVIVSGDDLLKLRPGQRRWHASTITAAPTTGREREVAELLAGGATTVAIAERLGLSTRTVTAVRRALRDKEATMVDRSSTSVDVGVIGPPGLLRDLVVDTLTAHGRPAASVSDPGQARHALVFVAPIARDFAQPASVRSVVVGPIPRSTGMVGAVRCGTVAVFDVTVSVDRLVAAVDAARSGRIAFSADVVQQLADSLYATGTLGHALTDRERAVLDSIGDGESVKQSARRLGVSAKTIEATRRNVYRKMGVRTAHEARLAARRT